MAPEAPQDPNAWKSKPGVRVVLRDDAGRVLVLLRPVNEEFFGGYWNLPGGAKEDDESFLQGARRELKEETGLEAEYTGESYTYHFPGGTGRAFLFQHPRGAVSVQPREVAEYRWVDPGDLPSALMPTTAEIVSALAGREPLMRDLELTPERATLERDSATAFRAWLEPWVKAIAREKGLVIKGLDTGHFKGTDAEGEAISRNTLERAAKLGRSEAARAILADAKRGALPHGRRKQYRDETRAELRSLARKNVRLVRETTERELTRLALQAEAKDVTTLINKLYDVSRAEKIAVNTVAGGYVRGVADTLRAHGYTHVYPRTMGDDAVCARCREMIMQRPRMTIRQFLATYPLHPFCRCYCHVSPHAPEPTLAYREKNTARIVKSMTPVMSNTSVLTLQALTLGGPGYAESLAILRGDRHEPDVVGDLIKSLAPEKKTKRKDPDPLPRHAIAPREMTMPELVDLRAPHHLVSAGQQIRAHLDELPLRSPERKHLHAQYEVLRQITENWHADRRVERPDASELSPPAFVPNGKRVLTSPRGFELGMRLAKSRAQLLALAHYLDDYKRAHALAGPEWDAVWNELVALLRAVTSQESAP